MAKFQRCMFKRTKHTPNRHPVKAMNKLDGWERGIAKVSAFGLHDVEFIVDENGEKIKEPWDYKLLSSYSHCTIDTESPDGAF